MHSYIVQCKCGTYVYTGSYTACCPDCNTRIRIRNNQAFYLDENTELPLLARHKFLPSKMHYFIQKYPKIGEIVTIIMEDCECFLDKEWTQELQDSFEYNLTSFDNSVVQPYGWLRG